MKKKLSYGKKESIWGFIFILPWLIGVLAFQFWPIIMSLAMSFTNYSLFGRTKFIGLENYIDMFNDDLFFKATSVTFKYVIMSVPPKIIFALIVALIMNQKIKGVGFYRTVYYIPSIFGSSIAVSILWKRLFVKDGIINILLSKIGITGAAWLGDPKWVIPTLGLMSVWQFGSSMVIFLAGLKQIPASLYESASVDGAGPIRQFFSISLPGIMPLMTYNLMMQTINAFQVFSAPYTIYGGMGGPTNSALVYVSYLYRNAFQNFDVGYSSALSWMLLVMIGATAMVIHYVDKYANSLEE